MMVLEDCSWKDKVISVLQDERQDRTAQEVSPLTYVLLISASAKILLALNQNNTKEDKTRGERTGRAKGAPLRIWAEA